MSWSHLRNLALPFMTTLCEPARHRARSHAAQVQNRVADSVMPSADNIVEAIRTTRRSCAIPAMTVQ